MKKLFTAFALGLLLVGCAREYDDSELRNRVTTLETKVGNLEANMKAIQTATNDGMFVQKVEELVEDGKVVGVTVTYTTGQVVTFQISGAGAETNLSAIRNAAGKLCWALNGQIIQVDGKDLEVGQTPTFSVENGHLFVTVDGKKTDVGAMGGGLGDAIFKDRRGPDDGRRQHHRDPLRQGVQARHREDPVRRDHHRPDRDSLHRGEQDREHRGGRLH